MSHLRRNDDVVHTFCKLIQLVMCTLCKILALTWILGEHWIAYEQVKTFFCLYKLLDNDQTNMIASRKEICCRCQIGVPICIIMPHGQLYQKRQRDKAVPWVVL